MQLNPSERFSENEVVEKLSRILSVGGSTENFVTKQQNHYNQMWNLHFTLGQILCRELTKEARDIFRARNHLVAAVEIAAAVEGEESRALSSSLNAFAMFSHDQVSFSNRKRH